MPLNELDTLIPRYAQNKAELEGYKKICDTENAQIKAIMKEYALQHFETAGYKATYSVSTRETMDEEGLVSLFTSVPGFVKIAEEYGIVKQKPYVDFDALEHAIYNGKFSTDMLMELNEKKETKEVVTLKVTKIKKGNKKE